MLKSTKLLGLLAAASTVAFLVKSSQEKNVDINHIEGLNLEINPDILIDTAKNFVRANPLAKDMGAAILKKIVAANLGKK